MIPRICFNHISYSNNQTPSSYTSSFNKNEKKLLKFFLVSYLHQFFHSFYHKNFQFDLGKNYRLTTECYEMDEKIIGNLISEIVKTGEYTIEGIATYTKIPLDIIIDATCGTCNQLSVTLWTRIIDLYMQVKPDVSKVFFDKLVSLIEKNNFRVSCLLTEI